MKKNFAAPWFIRRIVYAIAGIILIVLAGFGIIQESQIDSIGAQISAIAGPAIGVLVSLLAGANAHKGSDSTVTTEDVEKAARGTRELFAGAESYGRHALETTINSTNDYARMIRGE